MDANERDDSYQNAVMIEKFDAYARFSYPQEAQPRQVVVVWLEVGPARSISTRKILTSPM